MNTFLFAMCLILVAACSEPNSSLTDKPVVLLNNAQVSVFYIAVGLETSYRIDPAPTIQLNENRLPEVRPGGDVSLNSIASYESEDGICIFTYKIQTVGGVAVLQLTAIRQVHYEELGKANTIIVE